MLDPATFAQLALSVPVLLVVFWFLIYQRRQQREADEARDKRRQQEEIARDERHRELVGMQQKAATEVADRHERMTEKIAATFDRIIERHEGVEAQQAEQMRDGHREISMALNALTRQLARSDDTFSNLAHEVHAMSTHDQDHNQDRVIQPGVPGGVPTPIFYDESALQSMDLMSETRPWTHRMHGVDALHTHGHMGDPRVLIAVLDTGVQTVPGPHPDLPHVDYPNCRDFVGQGINDGHGHGAHVTGTVTAFNANASRVLGVAPKCTVVHYKVLSNQGSGSGIGIQAAIRAVGDLPGYEVKIISGSFGSSGEDHRITAAVKYAKSKGVIQVYAAGNSGPNSPNWPGMLEECIAVGASDPNGNVARFSSSLDDYVDVTAGGVDIPSTFPGGRIAVMSGTSMATPLVAGIVGVAVSYALERTGLAPTDAEVKEALYATCEPHTSAGRDSRGGYGKVRGPEFADALAKLVAKRVPVKPDPKPDPTPTPGQPIRIAVPDGAKFVVVDFAKA